MPVLPRSLATLALLLCAMPVPARAGPLKDIEDSARPAPTRPPDRGRDDAAEADEDDTGSGVHIDTGDSDASSAFWFYVFLLPWAVPRAVVDDPCAAGFAAYPYADGRGNLRHEPRGAGCALATAGPVASRRWAMQTDLEGGYALQGVIGGTLAARLQLPYRFELSGRVGFLHDLQERPREQALHGTAHLSLRFAQAPRIELRSGLGVRAFSLGRPLYGVDVLYAMDVFGKRPIIGRLELHIGTLGNAGAGQVRLSLGYMLGKLELYAGYDHTAFWGDAGTTRLSGPLLGLRAWF